LAFPSFSGAVWGDTGGGAVQPYEVSQLSEPALVNVDDPLDPLVWDEIPMD